MGLDAGLAELDETQKDRGTRGQVQVCAAKQAVRDVAALGRALDKAGGFEIGETAIKGPLGLHGALAQQFTTRVDFPVGLFGVNRTGEGG
ncbi:hypothetical protein UC34_25535 (plasmid) [Pandoraea vervacti]|uniref:Uncharacterized protein n=1 Tax=Pandoraea vervacti TaxID=656178 RepID=A0ABN4U6Z6_9BURK|nr:hypothetical protein UC34_25535 [Pandoraea vervacti]